MALDLLAGLPVSGVTFSSNRLILALLLSLPQLASACAVCSDGEKQNAMAFFWTTILLTAIPLLLLGFLVRWAQVKSKSIEGSSEDDKMEVIPPST